MKLFSFSSKKKIVFALTIAALVLVVACKKDKKQEEDTGACIRGITEANATFEIEAACDYYYFDTISDTIYHINLVGVEDNRTVGDSCDLGYSGGSAAVRVHFVHDSIDSIHTFQWPGCDGTDEYPIDTNILPEYINGIDTFRMVKLYPYSEELDTGDVRPDLDEYSVKLVLIKEVEY